MPKIGPILLALSWILLRLEGKGLDVLGVNAPALRLRQFGAGFLVAGLAVTVQQLGHAAVADVPWRLNRAADVALLGRSIRWNVNSVLYEELLFRGYLLYQAIRRLGARRGVLLAAAAFGVYHWFSYGIVGNPVMMVYVFVLTGAFGFMFARAFATTKSIALPIGVHLGWNLVSYAGFSTVPLGPGLFLPSNGAARLEATGLSSLLLNVVLPLVLVTGVCVGSSRGPRRPRFGAPSRSWVARRELTMVAVGHAPLTAHSVARVHSRPTAPRVHPRTPTPPRRHPDAPAAASHHAPPVGDAGPPDRSAPAPRTIA